jgi:hypothetical protein
LEPAAFSVQLDGDVRQPQSLGERFDDPGQRGAGSGRGIKMAQLCYHLVRVIACSVNQPAHAMPEPRPHRVEAQGCQAASSKSDDAGLGREPVRERSQAGEIDPCEAYGESGVEQRPLEDELDVEEPKAQDRSCNCDWANGESELRDGVTDERVPE